MKVSITTLSEWTQHDRRTIKRRLDGLDFEDNGRGGYLYDSASALRRIYLGNPSEDSDLDPPRERAALDRARRHLAEIELEVKRGNLIPVERVQETWQTLAANVRSRLLALPGRLAVATTGTATLQDSEREAKKLIHECLSELSATGTPR